MHRARSEHSPSHARRVESCRSIGRAEIRVAPIPTIVFREPILDRVRVGAVVPDGDGVNMLDPALDVVTVRSLRDQREEPAKTDITAFAALDAHQAAITDGAAALRGDREPPELCGIVKGLR